MEEPLRKQPEQSWKKTQKKVCPKATIAPKAGGEEVKPVLLLDQGENDVYSFMTLELPGGTSSYGAKTGGYHHFFQTHMRYE